MDLKKPRPGGRRVEATIEINASVEAVWKALTDAGELVRWFPSVRRGRRPGTG